MATRSTISIHKNDGEILSVYCHWDGYYEYNGVILYNFYDTADKVKKLISYGSISSLGTEIGKKHDFMKSYYGCTFYHRDRREEKDIQVYEVHSDVNPYVNVDEEEYNYMFVESKNAWLVKKENSPKWIRLESVFNQIPLKKWMVAVSNEKQYKKMKEFYSKYGNFTNFPDLKEVVYEV